MASTYSPLTGRHNIARTVNARRPLCARFKSVHTKKHIPPVWFTRTPPRQKNTHIVLEIQIHNKCSAEERTLGDDLGARVTKLDCDPSDVIYSPPTARLRQPLPRPEINTKTRWPKKTPRANRILFLALVCAQLSNAVFTMYLGRGEEAAKAKQTIYPSMSSRNEPEIISTIRRTPRRVICEIYSVGQQKKREEELYDVCFRF